jgi:hypothetical protein
MVEPLVEPGPKWLANVAHNDRQSVSNRVSCCGSRDPDATDTVQERHLGFRITTILAVMCYTTIS